MVLSRHVAVVVALAGFALGLTGTDRPAYPTERGETVGSTSEAGPTQSDAPKEAAMQVARARALAQLAEQKRPALVSLVSRLVSSPSPYGTSAAATLEIIAELLEPAGFRVVRSTEDPEALADHPDYMPPPAWTERPVNLVATPERVAAAPIALFAHIDTEPPKPGWSSAPTTPVVLNGRLYGLGAADDKGGVAAAVIAALTLAEAGRPAPTLLIVHGKGGGARGSLPAFTRLRNARAAVYVHPAETGHGMTEVKHSSRGVLDLALAVKGWRGREREVGTPESAPFAEGGDALEACLALLQAVRQNLPPTASLNVGRLVAGDRPGTVPDQCQADLRVLFESGTADAIFGGFNEAIARTAPTLARPGGAFTYAMRVGSTKSNPVALPWDSPLCRIVRRSVADVTGTEPASYAGHLTSDIRFPIRVAGIPSLGVGSRGGNFYGPDEWVDVDDLVRLVAVLMLTVERWETTIDR